MPFIPVEGGRLHTQRLGSGPRAVVLIHGIFENMAAWYFSLAPALARTNRVLLYDLRGHGLSSRTVTGYTLSAMSNDLATVVRSLPDRTVSLVGFSFGALVALRYAASHPEDVDRLVAVEPPLPLDFPAMEARLLTMESPHDLLEALPQQQRPFLRTDRRSSAMTRAAELVATTDLRAALRAEPDIPDDHLAAITARILFCYGLDSPIEESGVRSRLERLLPGATHASIPGGHFLPTTNPRRLTALVAEFLNDE